MANTFCTEYDEQNRPIKVEDSARLITIKYVDHLVRPVHVAIPIWDAICKTTITEVVFKSEERSCIDNTEYYIEFKNGYKSVCSVFHHDNSWLTASYDSHGVCMTLTSSDYPVTEYITSYLSESLFIDNHTNEVISSYFDDNIPIIDALTYFNHIERYEPGDLCGHHRAKHFATQLLAYCRVCSINF